ncbi:dTDP-4-dehydrorhamnose 3,5-epimerase [Mesorhizobium sp. NBSH29]|nr:dTDP-4-dehydrorhamnose 3,5-epimerase [Mesorhizobium sp. NBSH29]
MDVRSLGLDGVVEITPKKFGDDRGFFSETYNAQTMTASGIDLTFVQDNHSLSASKGVVRGLHYQLPPFAQDKLVRVIRGSILDVAVDIRRGSATFGKWVSLEVSASKWNQILVPKGFAHGFMTLEDDTEVIYKVTGYYSAAHDRGIRFDDPGIGIEWPEMQNGVQLSDKDQKAPSLADAEVFPEGYQ